MTTISHPRTAVYVDGFNLFYGSLKKTSNKWLDIDALCRAYLKTNDIVFIKYFTALVGARPNDPQQTVRQQTYLRALATIPHLEVIHGHYLSHTVKARLAKPLPGVGAYVDIIKTEEKGSDVNLATHLLHDAHLNKYDIAVVISNDSDLLAPIKIVRNDIGKQVGVLNPQKNPSRVLLANTDFFKAIRAGALASCQFPNILSDSHGVIQKPPVW